MVFKSLVLFTSGNRGTHSQRHSAPCLACLHFGAFHLHSRNNSLGKKREVGGKVRETDSDAG